MHIGIKSDNLIEYFALKLNLVADPLIKTNISFIMARSIMTAVEIGLFEALVEADKNSAEIAISCHSQLRPTQSLLNAMVSCDYLGFNPANEQYRLKPAARKWLIRSSPHSIRNKLLLQNIEWNFMNHLSQYVLEGKCVDLHRPGRPDVWEAYQKGMADIGKLALSEVASRVPIPKSAKTMLDIGGSGGTYSAAFVKSRPELSSMIIDLPDAVEYARELVHAHALPRERLDIRAGNVMEEELGTERYDFIFMANVAHHLSESDNQILAIKIKKALKVGGVYCILEPKRTELPSRKTQFGAMCDLYFGLTSQAGTWSEAEMSSWLIKAKLKLGKTIPLRTGPGVVLVHGQKKASDVL